LKMKRGLPARGEDMKKARLSSEPIPEVPTFVPPNLPVQPQISLPPNVILPSAPPPLALQEQSAQANHGDAIVKKMKAFQRREIKAIEKLLSEAYADAPAATENPYIFIIADQDWGKLVYEDEKSLAEVLHTEGGWTESTMLKWIGGSPFPFNIKPLSDVESRALWASIRYRLRIKAQQDMAQFEIKVPEEWLNIKLKHKEFGKTGGKNFAMKLLAMVAYNQTLFLGKDQNIWFRALCDQLGWMKEAKISENFVKRHIVSLFVIACNPEMLGSSVKDIKGSWGGSNRGKFETAWTNAVKVAIQSKTVLYPSELQLLQNLFPSVLS